MQRLRNGDKCVCVCMWEGGGLCLVWPGQNEIVISFRPDWNEVHFILAEMRCPFRLEWNVINIILATMKWSSHFGQNEMVIFFGQNEMTISFWPKWDVHFGHNKMEFISFWPEWNGHLISAEMKCHFFDSLKKYAGGRGGGVRTGQKRLTQFFNAPTGTDKMLWFSTSGLHGTN